MFAYTSSWLSGLNTLTKYCVRVLLAGRIETRRLRPSVFELTSRGAGNGSATREHVLQNFENFINASLPTSHFLSMSSRQKDNVVTNR